MRIFGKQTTGKACGCQTPSIKAATMNSNEEEAGIKILGSGCAKCAALEKAVRTAAEELKLNWPIAHVTDWTEIAANEHAGAGCEGESRFLWQSAERR